MQAITYSFRDVTFVLASPIFDAFVSTGQVGLNEIQVAMLQERTTHDVASDGTVMPSFIDGDNGHLVIVVQQTSILHAFLLAWYNALKVAAQGGDVSNWASTVATVRSLTDGTQHVCTGVSPSKIPDKVYQKQGQNVSWMLMCTDIETVTIQG